MSTTVTVASSYCAAEPWRKDCFRSSWTTQHQDEGKPGVTQLMMELQSVQCELRASAEAQLHSLARDRWPDLAALLACEVGDASRPPESRQMAALTFKNLLRWQQQDGQVGDRCCMSCQAPALPAPAPAPRTSKDGRAPVLSAEEARLGLDGPSYADDHQEGPA